MTSKICTPTSQSSSQPTLSVFRLRSRLSRLSSLGGGVAAGLASVVGAGLISVPAAVLDETGSAAMLTWVVAALACLPMIMLFRDTVVASADSSDPLRDTITAGLGHRVSAMVPIMFAMVVVVGLPSGAVMAARNLSVITGSAMPEIALAGLLLGFAVLINLRGRALGNSVEKIGAIVLVVALIAVVVWSLTHPAQPPEVVPDSASLALVPAGILVAFWAFIGFENLTFLARELPNPRRDFTPVAMITLALLLILVVSLTLVILVQTPRADPVTGVVDALRLTPFGAVAAIILAVSGLLGMALNAVAWVRGVGSVVSTAARDRILPRTLAVEADATPHRAVLVLSVGFAISLFILFLRPELVVDMLAAASGVFELIYILCIVAYIRAFGVKFWTLANLALVPLLGWSLVSSGSRAIFPVVVLIVAAIIAFSRTRTRTRTRQG